jgi:ABC-type transport system involved in multi-copper enzyme maturation permease subunit
MNQIFAITLNTFKENYRNRFFGVMFLLSVALLLLSLLLGELSFEEHHKILFDVGISGIHTVMLVMTIFMGSFTLHREFEKQTYMTLLASPLRRGEFLIGKMLGLWTLIIFTLFGLSLLLFLLLDQINFINFFLVFYGIILESIVLLTCSFLFALTLSPVVGLLSAFTIYFIGNWLDDLYFFAKKSGSDSYLIFAKIIKMIVPNLQDSNWRYFYLLNDGIPSNRVVLVSFHLFLWSLFLFFISNFVFKRKSLT